MDKYNNTKTVVKLTPTNIKSAQLNNSNKLGTILKVISVTALPPLLGHYIRRKNGKINDYLVGFGIGISLLGSISQNLEQFQTLKDSYLSKEVFESKHDGLEQYIITRKPSEIELFQENNPNLTSYYNSELSIKNLTYVVSHGISNLLTPIPIATIINRIQGNKPEIIHEITGYFTYDVINSEYIVNPNGSGLGNCHYSIRGDKVNFENLLEEKIKCEQAFNLLN